MRNCTNLRGAFRETGASFSFLSRKGALTHHLRSRRWYPSRWSGSCALHEQSFRQFSRGGRKCRKSAFPVQSALLRMQKNWCLSHQSGRYSACLLRAKTCHRQLCHRDGQHHRPFSLCKEKQKLWGRDSRPPLIMKEGEPKWQFII